MKKLLLLSLLWCTVAAVGAAELKIAVIDMKKIFDEYYKTKIADANLKQQTELYRAWIKKLNESLMKMDDEYKILRDAAQNIAISETDRERKRFEAQKKYQQMKEKKIEIDQYAQEKQNQYKEMEAKKWQEIIAEIKEIVQRKAILEGYSLVIDNSGTTFNGISPVIYSNPVLDITKNVITELNRGHGEEKKPEESAKN